MLSRRSLLRLGSLGAGLAWSPSLLAQRRCPVGTAAAVDHRAPVDERSRPALHETGTAGPHRESQTADGRGKDRRDPDEWRLLAAVLREHVVRRRRALVGAPTPR